MPATGLNEKVVGRKTSGSNFDYPHIVRPIPVWLADSSHTSKMTAKATAESQMETTKTSAIATGASSQSESYDDLLNSLQHDPIVVLTNGEIIETEGAVNRRIPQGLKQKGKSVSFGVDNSGEISPTNVARRKSSASAVDASPRSGMSRWIPFVYSTMNIDTEPGTERVNIDALNAQTDLEGEWEGATRWNNEQNQLPNSQMHMAWWRSLLGLRPAKSLVENSTEQQYYQESKRAGYSGREGTLPFSRTKYMMSQQTRQQWKPKLMQILLNNPYVPLTLRFINFVLSVVALGLACSIFVESRKASPEINQQPSTIMALCCQTTALVYLVYITYDEYASKPLGLRDAKSKIRLIMLDLLFIIISSANLALAFNTLYDSLWLCQADDLDRDFLASSPLFLPYNHTICSRQRGLVSFIFLSLISWVISFIISIFRLIERVSN